MTEAAVSPEARQAADEWLAAEAAEARRTAAQVDAMRADEAQAGAPPPSEPAPAQPAAMDPALAQLCGVAWAIIDRLVTGWAGPQMALLPAEREQLAALSVPVLNKYLPDGLGSLLSTPEGALLGTAAIIYAAKSPALLLGPSAPAASPPASPTPAAEGASS